MRQQETMGVYRKHGSNLEQRHQCQNHRCDSGSASRPLNLPLASEAFRVVLLWDFSVFSLSLCFPSCFSATKDQWARLHAKLPLSLLLCSTTSLHLLLCLGFYCRVLSLSPARSDLGYLSLATVSLRVADMLQHPNSSTCTNKLWIKMREKKRIHGPWIYGKGICRFKMGREIGREGSWTCSQHLSKLIQTSSLLSHYDTNISRRKFRTHRETPSNIARIYLHSMMSHRLKQTQQ